MNTATKKGKIYLGLLLFVLGLAGVFSLLTIEIPLSEDMRNLLLTQYTPGQIKWLLLVNPLVMLMISVVVGTLLYRKTGFEVPLIEGLIYKEKVFPTTVLAYGIAGGILAGIAILVVGWIYQPVINDELLELGQNLQPNLLVRFLYGGITEEILMRFGLMTLISWLTIKISGKKVPVVYWTGIVLATLFFALGHFPAVYQAVADPGPLLLSYILVGNSVGGLIFGWLYWKQGLESAMVAHIFAHLVMVTMNHLLLNMAH